MHPAAIQQLRADFDETGCVIVDDAIDGPLPRRVREAAEEVEATGRPWVFRTSLGRQAGAVRQIDASSRTELQQRAAAAYAADSTAAGGVYAAFDYLRPCVLEQGLPDGYHLCDVVDFEGCALCDLTRGMTAPALWRWCQRVSGVTLEPSVTLMLTAYRQGDFLSLHDDVNVDPPYRLAFILYLKDATGALRFKGKQGWQTVQPKANRLVLFEPDTRSQHEVLPAGPGVRLTVSGWFTGG